MPSICHALFVVGLRPLNSTPSEAGVVNGPAGLYAPFLSVASLSSLSWPPWALLAILDWSLWGFLNIPFLQALFEANQSQIG